MATDPLPPVHEDDPYYWTEPDDLWDEERYLNGDDEEYPR